MAHKVHPKIFRIKEISDWNSRGFYNRNLAKYLEEDFKIRELIRKRLKDCALDSIEIERFPGKINVIINTARPGLIIGRGGRGAEEIRKNLEKEIFLSASSFKPKKNTYSLEEGTKRASLKKENRKLPEIKIEIKGIREIWASPNLVVEWIAQRLEKRIHFRRVIKQTMDKIMSVKTVKGARIEVSGRLGGAEIARREWLQKGNLPRQTIRANIDYGSGFARCSYGVIGVKVWIYKGEKFE